MESKKKPSLDNERIKLPLLFLGLFIVGSLMLLSFSYETPFIVEGIDRDGREKGDIPEEIIVIDEPEVEPIVQKITPPEIIPLITPDIEPIKSKDEDEKLNVEVFVFKINKEKDDDPPVIPIDEYPGKEAMFPGGAVAMKKFLLDEVKYPEISKKMGDQGRVFLEFIIEKDGSISRVDVLRGVSKEIDEEAKRVINKMPKWTPAETNGEPVRTIFRIPINFSFEG